MWSPDATAPVRYILFVFHPHLPYPMVATPHTPHPTRSSLLNLAPLGTVVLATLATTSSPNNRSSQPFLGPVTTLPRLAMLVSLVATLVVGLAFDY